MEELGSSSHVGRVVLHLDLDCFFVQVETLKDPRLEGHAVAVQQHNDIISADYAARRRGVRKHMTPAEALALCPDLKLVHVRRTEGTSKVTYEDYQKASAGVQTLLQNTLASLQSAAASGVNSKRQDREAEAPPEVEKASIDDFYVDVTSLVAAQLERGLLINDLDMPASQMASQSSEWPGAVEGPGLVSAHILTAQEVQLREGARIAASLREAVHTKCGLRVSAGVAQNKLLAKLASSASKPDGQTTVLPGSVPSMLARHPPSKIPQLGVKLGKEKRGVLLAAPWTDRVKVISDLASTSLLPELRLAFGDDKAEWLHRVGQGIDDTPVKDKGPPKSLMSSMSLTSITNDAYQFKKILRYLADELCKRLKEDELRWKRKPRTFNFSFRLVNEKESSHTMTMKKVTDRVREMRAKKDVEGAGPGRGASSGEAAASASADAMCSLAFQVFNSTVGDRAWKVRWAGMSARDFHSTEPPKGGIATFFSAASSSSSSSAPLPSTSTLPSSSSSSSSVASVMAMPPPTSPSSSALKRPSPPASPAKSPATITTRVAKQGSSPTSPKRAKTNKNATPQGNTMLAYFTVATSPSREKPTAT